MPFHLFPGWLDFAEAGKRDDGVCLWGQTSCGWGWRAMEAGEGRSRSREFKQPLSSVSLAPFELQPAIVLGRLQLQRTHPKRCIRVVKLSVETNRISDHAQSRRPRAHSRYLKFLDIGKGL